jgi:LCP family protein required for cell wall assembly
MNEEIITGKKLSKRKIWLLRLKRKVFKHVWVLRAALLVVGITAVYLTLLLIGLVVRKTQVPFYLGLTRDFIFVNDSKIKSFEGRTNILLLGKGGGNHEAGDLTDTIIFASIPHPATPALRGASNKVGVILISLPRDIWIPELRAKLNSAYYWGNQKKEGGGLVLAKSTVEQIVGEPVHYALVLDFEGFKKVIDVLEGIEIDVERTFVDERYPIPGREDDKCDGDAEYKCRYEMVTFEKGVQIMNGDTALKFVRSRNAEGDEGTDFAREERQQNVIDAIKEKVMSSEVILSPKKLIEVKGVLSKYMETDIDSSAAAILSRRMFQSRNNVNSQLLPEKLLVNPPKSPRYDNLYVFIPKVEGWSEVHEWVECVLKKRVCS